MNNQMSLFIKRSVWIVVILFVVRCAMSFENISTGRSLYDLWSYTGEAIAAATIIMIFYEKKLWKYDPFVKIPRLHKEYEGVFISSYDSKERKATMTIKQSLLSVEVILKTDESKSKSLSASIDNILGESQLTYSYLNTPNASVRERSAIHYGTAMLCVDNPDMIEGTYFSDRKTTGDMIFKVTH